MTHDELNVFLSLCKQVRECQNLYGGLASSHLFALTNIKTEYNVKRLYAIVYSLEKKGYVNINNKKCVSLTHIAMQCIKSFKKNK